MIVFALYLHICTTQTSFGRQAEGLRTVTACGQLQRGAPYTSQALCDRDGKAALGPMAGDTAEDRKVDAYECRAITLNSK